MKIDQNQPGPWLGAGAVLIVLGAIAVGAAADTPGIGWFLIIAGAVLAVVGLVIFAVRAGSGGNE